MVAHGKRFFADPEMLGVRVVAVDATNTTFRFRALTDLRDGTTLEVNDAGEIDATGRISVILTFAGPLEECATSPLGSTEQRHELTAPI